MLTWALYKMYFMLRRVLFYYRDIRKNANKYLLLMGENTCDSVWLNDNFLYVNGV